MNIRLATLASSLAVVLGLASCSQPPPAPGCVDGEQNCNCKTTDNPFDKCEAGLTCTLGKCLNCRAGDLDCGCLGNGTCANDTMACSGGVCLNATCTAGIRGCKCDASNACSDGSACEGGQCVDPAGHTGKACFANRTCLGGNQCVAGVCQACDFGALGCGCLPGDQCAAGLGCLAGVCAWGDGLPHDVPANPVCYTPCKSGLLKADGTYLPCSAEGLLEGCVGGLECINGTCASKTTQRYDLPPGSACSKDADCDANALCVGNLCQALCFLSAGNCKTDVDCPAHQVCLESKCYSNCKVDADCGASARCHKAACRLPCQANAGNNCSEGKTCVTTDGKSGFCLPNAVPTTSQDQGPSAMTFQVVESGAKTLDSIAFTNISVSASFEIVNDNPDRKTFTVRKVSHREFAADGTSTEISDNALNWILMGKGTAADRVQQFTVDVDGTAAGTTNRQKISLQHANNSLLARWEGTLEISAPNLGRRLVQLSYRESPAGRWQGRMHYFSLFNTEGLDAWRALTPADKLKQAELAKVKNAFLQQWARLKSGSASVDEFKAMVSATTSGAWNTPFMKQGVDCDGPNEVCFPYDNPKGYVVYTSDSSTFEVPAGMTEFPIAINLKPDPTVLTGHTGLPAGATGWSGKIATNTTLHYAGDPKTELIFETSPTDCAENAQGAVLCQVTDFAAQINVGARFIPSGADCSEGGSQFGKAVPVPFLVKGFKQGISTNKDGSRYRNECRDQSLPFGNVAAFNEANTLAATSNPIPDGRQRKRSLSLVDGALIDQKTLVILFQENVKSFLGVANSDFSGLGFMLLERNPVTLDPSAFEGSPQTPASDPATDLLRVGCSAEVMSSAGVGTTFPATDADKLRRLGLYVLGSPSSAAAAPAFISEPPSGTDKERVHWLCEDTGLIDGGADPANPIPCPAGSQVTFFATKNSAGATEYASQACQGAYRDNYSVVTSTGVTQAVAAESAPREITAKGTCRVTMQSLADAGKVRLDPLWRCKTDGELAAEGVVLPGGATASAYCEFIRTDLRREKRFYQMPDTGAGQSSTPIPLESAVAQGFLYKTKFKSRSGKSIGFAPVECGVGQEYCYSPEVIEDLRDRVDCLAKVYTEGYDLLAAKRTTEGTTGGPYTAAMTDMQRVLRLTYAYVNVPNPFTVSGFETQDGFERSYAELLVMLGDESYTSAFASRFDLAGSAMLSFPGTLFEGVHGLNLSGGAGYEMYVLYQAAQYYDLALERFYRTAPLLWRAVELGEANGFITAETVSSYFKALTRASTQKAAAYDEIAKRYQNFNRPDLARQVVERAYSGAYLESIVISNMLAKVRTVAGTASKPEIKKNLEEAAGRYRSAMISMRDLYGDITDRVNFFGFPVEYVPSPSLNELDVNIFEKQLGLAKDRLSLAASKEALALANNRSFETDATAFQNELSKLQSSFDDQLAEVCGTFKGTDQQIHPATPAYVNLLPTQMHIPDPCGLVGNGGIHDAMGEVDLARLEMRKVLAQQQVVLGQIANEQTRIGELCAAYNATATYQQGEFAKVEDLNKAISDSNIAHDEMARITDHLEKTADILKCNIGTSSDCLGAAVGIGLMTAGWIVSDTILTGIEAGIENKQQQIQGIQDSLTTWETERECVYATIESQATIKNLWLEMLTIDLEALQAAQTIRLAVSRVEFLRNRELSTLQSLEDATQLTINLEAARNDPNVRIYKNDDILAADRTFQAALKEAYKATKVYEYFSSQSYAHAGDLFLVRMVQHGDLNLEAYLFDLENAYLSFRESYGTPDTRVQVISARDDIFKIGHIDPATTMAYCESDRVLKFRKALQDVTLLDESGYIVLSFPTSFKELSPLTRDHKVLYVEAELIGGDLGDAVGRLYLRQRGTGAVKSVGGEKLFYTQPAKTAVINTFMNGRREFDEAVYHSERLRDRPYVNTQWQLIINKKDELANKDINLNSLSDIRLYVYYTDYTAL
ncbi:MAG TPA: hypothetical protein VGK67_01035 [Myxococcales bacterium]|jgi:hypothetical protein